MLKKIAYKIKKPAYRKRFVAKAIGYTKATQEQIGARIGISTRYVRRIAKKMGVKRKYRVKTGPKGRFRKLLPLELAAIRRLKAKGCSAHEIARRLGVSEPAIHYALKRQ